MNLLFEEKHRELLVKKKIDGEFGVNPNERSVDELIHTGIVNINKVSGPSSHQVTDYVKKILGISKAGHSGTLE